MIKDILKVGDKIDIQQVDKDEYNQKSVTLYSKLVDIIDDMMISISMPTYNGTSKILHQGIVYQLYFYTSKGLYVCECTVEKTYRENNIIMIQMMIISPLKKIQRRQYYRLECLMDIELRLITDEEKSLKLRILHKKFNSDEEFIEISNKLDVLDQQWKKASVTDISGGGAKFVTDEQYQKEDQLKMQFLLPINGVERKIILVAEVIASEKIMNSSDRFEHRVKFIDLSAQDREMLIRFIFEQDRLRMKNVK